MNKAATACLALAVAGIPATEARGQSYSLSGVTSGGGGIGASGSVYRLESTVGQPFATTASGASQYALATGFWSWPLTTYLQFTDDVLTPGVTPIRLVHVIELRSRIDALRARAGLGSVVWTDLQAGVTVIRAVPVIEMRVALAEAYTAMGRTPPVFNDPTLTGSPIRALHIAELRAVVRALE